MKRVAPQTKFDHTSMRQELAADVALVARRLVGGVLISMINESNSAAYHMIRVVWELPFKEMLARVSQEVVTKG